MMSVNHSNKKEAFIMDNDIQNKFIMNILNVDDKDIESLTCDNDLDGNLTIHIKLVRKEVMYALYVVNMVKYIPITQRNLRIQYLLIEHVLSSLNKEGINA